MKVSCEGLPVDACEQLEDEAVPGDCDTGMESARYPEEASWYGPQSEDE